MKNYFLFALILIISIYSVNALSQGTIGFNIDESTSFDVGDQPSFEVENGGGSGSSGGGGSSGGRVIFSSESDTNENTAGFFQENISIVNGTRNDTNIFFNAESSGITGAVTGFVKSGKGATIFLTLIVVLLVTVLFFVLKKEKR